MYTIKKTTDIGKMELGRVDLYPWGGERRVEMLFKIGHDDKALYVNMLSYEDKPVAWATERNGEVWEDSCMEFFICPSDDLAAGYFNFETNYAPAILLYYGKDRDNRVPVDVEKWPTERLGLVRADGIDAFGRKYWKLSYHIPFALLEEYSGVALGDGSPIRANLFRCGANDQISHYGVWSPIDTEKHPKPDFHRPEYFGEMVLE